MVVPYLPSQAQIVSHCQWKRKIKVNKILLQTTTVFTLYIYITT